ncbi:DNA-directed DNA polymerase, partial [Tanacetum coccineum]
IYTAYSNKLNTAYQSTDITAETYSSYLISVLDFLCFLSSEPILLIVYPLFQLFKTPSLDESSSPEFDLFSDLEEHSEEEVAGTMTETMEEYMCKTRGDYGSGVTRPKIDAKDHFELKGQFLKELRDNTFSGSDHEDANEHIEKVLEIVDLFHIPNITQDQIMLRAFPMSLTGAASRWLRNKPSGSITTWEDLKTKFLSKYCPPARTAKKMEEINNFQQEPDETLYQAWERFKELLMKCPQHYLTDMQEVILFYNGLEVPTRQILDSKGAIPTKTVADAKIAIQEMAEYSQKWHNRTSKTRMGCELCKGPHYTKDCPLKEEGKTLEEAYYTQFGVPFQQGGQYRAAALGFYQRNNANPSYQERRQSMEESLSKFMTESAKRHEENSNMTKEIRASTDAAIENQGALIKTLEIQIWKMSKVLQERGSKSLPNSTETNPRDHVNSISTTVETDTPSIRHIGSTRYAISAQKNTLANLRASVSVMPLSTYLNLGLGELAHTKLTVELADRTMKHPKGIAKNVLVRIGKFVFPIDFIILDMHKDVNVPLILGRPFLSTAHAKVDVFKRKITLRVGDEKIIFKTIKPASNLIKRVYMLSLRERMELDLEARLIGETLILNRSLDPLYRDYIELNDLNVPLELRRDQVNDLMPTIEEGEVVDKPMIKEVKTRNDDKKVSKIFRYPSGYDEDEKIRIDYAYNLKFSCMIVVEDMDPYLDGGMGDVVVGEPFCKASCVEARRFDGIVTIRDGNDSVTYQTVRSNPRFKHLTNEKCNKIPPLLKVSEQDKINGISHSYQKLKGFYKGVLNLGPEFIRDAKVEEWLTRGHISMHEMEQRKLTKSLT